MSSLKRYLMSISLVFIGLLFAVALAGAVWLSAY